MPTRRRFIRSLPAAAAALGAVTVMSRAEAPGGWTPGRNGPGDRAQANDDPDDDVLEAVAALERAMTRAGWGGRTWRFIAEDARLPIAILDSAGRSAFRLLKPRGS